MSLSLIFAFLGCYLLGMASMFFLFVGIARREVSAAKAAVLSRPAVMQVFHRHDVHHHGRPQDGDLPGDEWKRE